MSRFEQERVSEQSYLLFYKPSQHYKKNLIYVTKPQRHFYPRFTGSTSEQKKLFDLLKKVSIYISRVYKLKIQNYKYIMLPNGDRGRNQNRQYLNPQREQTLRNSSSLNPRQFLSHYNHNNSPRPMADLRDKDNSRDFVAEKMRMMKSKAINLSINSRNGLNQNTLYPTELEGNVEHVRKTIEEEKKRVNRDFDNFSKQIFHMIQDLKLSIHSQLDFVFRDFINMYSSMKTQVIKMRENRKRIIQSLALQQYDGKPIKTQYLSNNNNNNINLSNLNLLQQISKDEDYFKNHRMYEEVTSAYFEAIGPIMMEAQNILSVGSQLQFYKDQKCNDTLTNIRNNFFGSTRFVFENQLDQLVLQTKHIVEDNNMLLKDLNIDEPRNERSTHQIYLNQQKYKQPAQGNINSNFTVNLNKKKRAETQSNPYGIEPPTFKNTFFPDNDKPKGLRPSSSSENIKYRPRPQSQWSSRKKDLQSQKQKFSPTNNGYHRQQKFKSTKDQQNVIIEWAESVQFNRSSTINSSNSQDILLCVLFLNQGKNIAVGSKDKNIYIYSTVGGKLVQTLAGHRASVCSLANFNNFFASGGDNGCGSLILWETATYKMKRKINLHTAALTCVVDLLDGSHLATGGYDKKINIYNYKKGESAFEVNTCRSGVTSLVICEQSRKLVSAGLDSTLTIWNIFTKNGELDTVVFQRIVTNCGLPCSLRSLILVPDIILVGNKDGKVMMINVHTGQAVRTLSVGRGSVLEMAVIQRHNKPQVPLILSCSNGEREAILTKGETCQNSKVRINIAFGCGIGPKIIFDDSGTIAVVNQSSVQKQIALYNIETS